MVDPVDAQKLSIKSLSHIFDRFPMLKDTVDRQKLDSEWRDHKLLDHEAMGLSLNQDACKYWESVFDLKNAANIHLFPNLKMVINLLLVLPFSNACVERIFSKLNNIKTENRNRLDTDTVKALLYTQEAVQKDGCGKWKPSAKMLNASVWRKGL